MLERLRWIGALRYAFGLAAACGLVGLLAQAPAVAQYSDQPNTAPSASVVVERQGADMHISAHAIVRASRSAAWAALTDYDRLASIVPDMTESRVVARASADRLTVRQSGVAGLWPFKREFTLLLALTEQPMERIDIVMTEGSFKKLVAHYALHDAALHDAPDPTGRIEVVYDAVLNPDVPVLPLIGPAVMRRLVREQFEAVLVEIERRAKAAEPAKASEAPPR